MNTDNRYACCEHCGDREGCPRPNGHASPCLTDGCPSHDTPMLGEDPGDAERPSEMAKLGVLEDIAEWHESERILKQRDDLVDGVVSMIGYEPPGLRLLIKTLSHPMLAGDAKRYFDAMDVEGRCTNYEPPWNCAREAEAQYQNIQHGWLGGGVSLDDEAWCDNCREKVMGTDA